MKRIAWQLVVVALVVGMAADFALAQAPQGGRGGFRGRTAEILCDALVLNTAQSEKVTATYQEINEKLRSEAGDMQSMSREERMEQMTKMQKEAAAALKKEMAGTLSEKALEAIEPVLALRVMMPDAQLRALRSLDLKDEQRAKLQPLATELTLAMVPSFPRGEGGPGEEAQKKFDDAKASFMAKASEILTGEQNEAWKVKADAVQKEQEEMRQQMRNRGTRGQ
ncbi:MAG: hypothetical protein C4527_09770 [Candidatus Omnitrophota bacterium]|nr:MAG: hypothetical protein C4527_09770 [Candidatus Omnitrophota bacterium]